MSARTSRSSGSAVAFPNIDFLNSLRPTRMKLGLENISRLLRLVGDPQESFPAVLFAGALGFNQADFHRLDDSEKGVVDQVPKIGF